MTRRTCTPWRLQPACALTLLLLALSGLIGGCGKSEVGGKVLLPVGPDQFKPAGLIRVEIVKGDLRKGLQQLAGEFDEQIVRDVTKQILPTWRQQVSERASELGATRASLAEFALPSAETQCAAAAQKLVASTRSGYTEYFDRLRPNLAALSMPSDDPATAAIALQSALTAKLANEAKRLKADYVSRRFVAKSTVIREAGGGGSGGKGGPAGSGPKGWSKLCWNVTNEGGLTVTGASLSVAYAGKNLPDSLLKHFWTGYGALKSLPLHTRNPLGEEVRGLGPGGIFELCLIDRRPDMNSTELMAAEPYGLSNATNALSGTWTINVDDITLTGAPASRIQRGVSAYWQFPAQTLVEAFDRELSAYRKQQPEDDLLEKLTSSESVLAYRRASEALATCQQALALEQQIAQQQLVTATLEKQTQVPADIRALLQDEIDKAKQTRKPEILPKAIRLIGQQRVGATDTSPEGTFLLPVPSAGEYTLLASNKTPQGAPVTWIALVNVQKGRVEQDLSAKVMQEGDLDTVIQRIVFGGDSSPTSAAGTDKGEVAGNDEPRKPTAPAEKP